MQFQVISDLHLDYGDSFKFTPAADYLIVAGDFGDGSKHLRRFLTEVSPIFKHVFFVLGNHDYYDEDFLESNMVARTLAASLPNVTFLDDTVQVFEDRVIFGGTMWTDFRGGRPLDMLAAVDIIPDFKYITVGDKLVTPEDMRDWHGDFLFALENAQALYGKLDLVITHFVPTEQSIHPKYADNLLNSYFTTGVRDLLKEKTVWVHGHTHESFDYISSDLHGSHVVCNPRGYTGIVTNKAYVNDKIITI